MHRFLRQTEAGEEVLTIVTTGEDYFSCWLDRDSPYLVQVTQGAQFSALCDLDGEVITASTWDIATDVPPDVITAVVEGWATGNATVEPLL